MVFIGTYKEAAKLVKDMETGACAGRCRQVWRHHIKYALNSKTNPLKLTASQKKDLRKKLREMKGKRTRKQRGGNSVGQALPYVDPSYKLTFANSGSDVQGIVPLTTIRPALNARPMVGGQILSPMSFEDAYHSPPHAPTGQALTDLTMPPTLRQGLNLGRMSGGRRHGAHGGFYPSIMGGVVSNAPLLAPLAARQGLELFSQYKASTRRRSRKQTRKTARRRTSGRR